ncbi:SusC/RagA family TonB-linked outer membrane protein [Aquimarina sp. 2201CG14-23]|uniref:SusC/RagA family TonB-linked outer membrane protein n=1 Tax=Aquimarina mycalae TaxID=3040073 RepID=UPI00247822E6|nr:TonB-dependent receptor [Aquimarina sp. 2201CG14-23]MDH7444780.1 TonB-dependent receptor [Aquimarina sp. 2201CG14-23]
MRTKFSGILTLFLALIVQITFAQEKTISGNVTDDKGLPLPGVNIVVKNTANGTQTDFDGNYSIKANRGAILTFTYVGFQSQEKAIGDSNTINVQLAASASELEEVVIEAYRTSTKATSNISAVTITAQSVEARPNASAIQTLQGQVSGLNITTNTGQPGGNSTINLRGVTSINGNSEPLFIIDGAPVDEDNFRSLNPNDISSVSVLKDAGATAIYGNRGANGVIIIKTKQGGYNSKLKVSYLGITSFSSLQSNDYDLKNSQEQLLLERELGRGLGSTLTDAEIAAFSTTNWDEVFFDTGITQNHTLSFTSGGENLSSFTSFGYYDQEGVLNQSGLKRFNLRSNVNGKSDNDKFTYGTNLTVNYSENEEPNSIGSGAVNRNYVLGAYQSVPYLSPADYTPGAGGVIPVVLTNTPLFLLDRLDTFERREDEIKIVASANASYKITDDITVNTVFSGDFTDEQRLRAEFPTSFNAILFAQTGNNTPGFQEQQSIRTFSFNALTNVNYRKTFAEKHTLDVTLFTEYFKAHLRTFGYREEGLDPATFSPGDGSGFIGDNAANDFFVDVANANILNAGLFSYFGQLDYDFDQKYGVTGVLRRDASYRFSESNRWGTFWSVAARWNISAENFMQDSVFDLLKLRASYGITGNQRILDNVAGPQAYFSAPDLTRDLFATGTGYGGLNSLFLSQIGNNTLKWETVTQLNVGLDFEVMERRLRGSFDYYDRETDELFQNRPISAINGATNLNANTGSLKNSGFDLSLNYDLIRGGSDGFNLLLKVVGNYNKQEILELPTDDGVVFNGGLTGLREGGVINEYFVYRYAGVNPANGELLFLDVNGNLTENPSPDTDRVWLDANIFPDYQGSFGFDADYKGFYLTAQFNYTIGVERFDFDLQGFEDPSAVGNFRSSRTLDRAWTPDNRVTDIPSLTASNRALDSNSDRYLRDSDYIRLRFASLGYSFPSKFLKNTGFTTVKAFVNGENLFTLSEWEGFDAESLNSTANRYPTPRIISVGFEFGF